MMLDSPPSKSIKLFQILVAAAWLDGEVQLEEQQYLQKIAQERGLETETTVQNLLANQKAIPATKCYQWLQQYLGSRPSSADYENLLSDISALVYSDGDIATEEANLLTQLQELDPENLSSPSTLDKLLHGIQRLYRRGIESV